ncbi:hypothetical protein V8F06_014937, partial [Rhypophila decipiens]
MLTVKPAHLFAQYDLPTMSEASAITKDSEVLTAVVIQLPTAESESRVKTHKKAIRWLGQLKRDVFSDLRSAPWLRMAQTYLQGGPSINGFNDVDQYIEINQRQ